MLQETSLLNDSIVRKEEEYIKVLITMQSKVVFHLFSKQAQERENRKHLMNAYANNTVHKKLILIICLALAIVNPWRKGLF